MSKGETTGAGHTGQLTVVTTATDGIRVLTPAGEIDHHTGDTLRDALDERDTPGRRIVVDMHQVTFMDSSGINILLAAHLDITAADVGWLRLADVQPSVMRTLNIVGLPHIVPCYPSVQEALTA
ncbi:STAS domain-containing protein [Streptomyces sp. NPDC040750]|uniref:STAS domain-containing protein n=1 Tax=Streptomyces sp. NPDC040750 TaxID=3154491 RepID=UPI00340F8582